MKKAILLLTILMAAGLPLMALEGEIVYVEGTVDLKTSGGDLDWADIGMPVETGDSIITGLDGYAELEMDDGSTVKVSEDSIFALSSYEENGREENNFQCVLGSVQYKFAKALKDKEPRITTPSTVCGIRGTEFTVFSGLDGSAIYVVDNGSVAVSAEGEEVILEALQGVEVAPGSAPGEVFPVLRGKIDYAQLKEEAEKRFLDSPVTSMKVMVKQLNSYIEEIEFYEKESETIAEQLDVLREELFKLEGDAKNQFYNEKVGPLDVKASYLKLNTRYYALSALSLRRHVVGMMYVNIRTAYIMDQHNSVYREFIKEYENFLAVFEKELVPFLVKADI